MATEWEPAVSKAVGRVIGGLSAEGAAALARYLASPDFDQVARQVLFARAYVSARLRADHFSAVREQIRQGLRLAGGRPEDRLPGLADVVLDALLVAIKATGRESMPVSGADVAQRHVTGAAARNGALLGRLADLGETHDELQLLRSQVARLHAVMRMAHLGQARSVPLEQLYVEPQLRPEAREDATIAPGALAEPGARHIVLGDPGTGKSTLAQKLCHDLAADRDGMIVPFLVVLRHFSDALEAGGRTLAEYLAISAKDPYNVVLAPETIEYLLLNGRGMIILDGLDELTDVALRRRVADLIGSFVQLYPLVPVVATSQRVGYADAGLDQSLFRTLVLAPFDRERVEAYVKGWFALESESSPAEQDRLAKSFLRESASIEDLRGNLLLLSVLCAMYSTDHYIPRNRGQIYERCALMVFDRWDRMRGIGRRLGFEGRVRGAVQYLAWHLLTGHQAPERPLREVLRILQSYLIEKGFDDDSAAEAAGEFLDYCAGRAWILTDVGSTAIEPVFGFTHRTFLEYFGAEYLVRSARTPEGVWAALAAHVRNNEWEVVARLSLQLIDRNVEDGAEVVLRLALDEIAGSPPGDRDALLAFCARSLGDVSVLPETAMRIISAALERAFAFGAAERFRVAPKDEDFAALRVSDGPLYEAMYHALPSNLPFVHRAVTGALAGPVEAGDTVARVLAASLGRAGPTEDKERLVFWERVRAELER
ncbi:NACHT domain-containing protein [Paractinoplanes globisporus]|uniref:NACHT domain-containing protein n=1 Tax=Paractinoplanes globisporus TaxID=113565 RepID=A0ABW6WS60_9ACTN|nr:NACHT domain-containing protein [Actinoplanes globisporus]